MTKTNINNVSLEHGDNDEISPLAENFFSSNVVRPAVVAPKIYDKWPVLRSLPPVLEMDYSRILSKPFLIANYNWPITLGQFTSLVTPTVFPGDIFTNNLIKIPFQASTLFRCKACFMVQVSGTTMHQGTLVASVTPYRSPCGAASGATNSQHFINNILASPHAFLNANNSTAACIEIPFNYNNKLCYCDPDSNVVVPVASGNNFAQLNLVVLNPLQAPSNASTVVNVVVHVIFEELEFYAPHVDITYRANPQIKQMNPFFSGLRASAIDFLDTGIAFIRSYTGLHNRNLPKIDEKMYGVSRNDVNNVDQETRIEKLDPYGDFDRKISDYTFYSEQDEMDVRFLFQKPYYIGTFNVDATTPAGAVTFTRPITPWMEINEIGGLSCLTFPLQIFHRLSKFWKGSLKLHIQSNMTAFHFCKLVVARNYSPVINTLTQYPNFLDVQNLLTETIEFSNGGLIKTVDLPYVSPFNQLECTQSPELNALQHGMVYIFLAQSLIVNGTVPQNVSFNVYLSSGDDFCYYGYPTTPLSITNALEPFSDLVEVEHEITKENLFDPIPKRVAYAKKQSSDTTIPMQVPSQEELETKLVQQDRVDDTEFRPIVSVRDIARRFYQYPAIRVLGSSLSTPQNRSVVIDVAQILGFKGQYVANRPVSPLHLLTRMYYGFVGGVKFKFRVNGASNVSVKYIPPGLDPNVMLNNIVNASALFPQPTNLGATQIVDYVATNVEALPYNAPGVVFPTVGIEAANYVHCQSYNTSSYGDVSFSSSLVEVEGVIPYMNPLSFVGDMAKAYAVSQTNFYSSNLGYIVLSCVPVASPDGATVSDLLITPFYGLSDESRYGLNTISLPAATTIYPGAVNYTPSPYNSSQSGVVPGGPASNTLGAPAAYYTRP